MAARTLYPAQVAMNWSEAKWSLADDNAQNQAKPAAGEGDTVYFSQNSAGGGTITLDENSAILTELDMALVSAYAGTLAFGSNKIDVDGDCFLAGTLTASAGAALEVSGYFAKIPGMTDLPALLDIELNGTGLVETNDIGGGTVTVNTAGTHTQIDKALWDAFTLTLGTYRGKSSSPGHGMDVTGDVTYAGGTLLNSGTLTMTGTADLSWGSATETFSRFIIDTLAAVTLTASSYGPALTVRGTLAPTAAEMFGLYSTSAGWWGPQTGTVSCKIYLSKCNSAPGNDITLENADLEFANSSAAKTVTMDANIDTGTGMLWLNGVGVLHTLDLNGKYLTCGAVRLGETAAGGGGGVLKCGEGIVNIASLARGAATNVGNAIDFEGAYIKLSGILEATGINCANSGGGPMPARIIGGTVNNVDLTGETAIEHFWPVAAAGNTNVTELSPLLHQVLGEVYVT